MQPREKSPPAPDNAHFAFDRAWPGIYPVSMKRDPIAQRDPRVLRSLQYFEAVARRRSVKEAAEELGVSPSAVSHQLRALRECVGEEILLRSGRCVLLTETGQQLFGRVTDLLQRLDEALRETVGQKRSFLRIAVCSSFGPAWLARRLPDFLERNPSIDVELRMYTEDPLQTDMVADVIVTANAQREGYAAVALFDENLVAVGGPQMALAANGLPQTLITTDTQHRQLAEDWRAFGATTGRDFLAAASGRILRCSHYMLAMALAEAGAGAALVPDFLAFESCRSGRLRRIEQAKLPAGRTYRFCYKIARARAPGIRALERWMKAQAERATIPVTEPARRNTPGLSRRSRPGFMAGSASDV